MEDTELALDHLTGSAITPENQRHVGAVRLWFERCCAQHLGNLDAGELDRGMQVNGERLFHLAFPDASAPRGDLNGQRIVRVRNALARAEANDTVVRLRLLCPEELWNLPWELIRVPASVPIHQYLGLKGEFLAAHPRRALVRQRCPEVPRSAQRTGPVRLVIAYHASFPGASCDLSYAHGTTTSVVFKGCDTGQWAAQLADELKPGADILHIAGHGDADLAPLCDCAPPTAHGLSRAQTQPPRFDSVRVTCASQE